MAKGCIDVSGFYFDFYIRIAIDILPRGVLKSVNYKRHSDVKIGSWTIVIPLLVICMI